MGGVRLGTSAARKKSKREGTAHFTLSKLGQDRGGSRSCDVSGLFSLRRGRASVLAIEAQRRSQTEECRCAKSFDFVSGFRSSRRRPDSWSPHARRVNMLLEAEKKRRVKRFDDEGASFLR